MAEMNLVEAIQTALMHAMSIDDKIVILGEDIAKNGGVFRVTQGLLEKFGEKRVLDTPLAESMLAGMALGMAANGLKPIVEFQFMGFIYPAFNHIVNHISRIRNRTRGRLSAPIVFRAPYGAGIHAPEHHSESTEAYFIHTPGLRVVVPSSPKRAYGLLLSAIDNPDPVIFLEPARLYRYAKQNVNNDGTPLPLDQCFVLREGKDLTMISWGAMLIETLAAADELNQMGISVEVIDVATLKPLDMETILHSIAKTGRILVIHEAVRSCGLGAEIISNIAEQGLFYLKAPPMRVTAPDTIVPYAKLEKYYLPSKQLILNAAEKLLEFA